jgi:hypothetical protein
MMKRNFTNLENMIKAAVVCSTLLLISFAGLHAQTVLSNVKVNSFDYSSISTADNDKNIAVLDENVYTVWMGESETVPSGIYFAKSSNNGQTFGPEVTVAAGSESLIVVFPSITVAADGTIYIAFNAVTNGEEYWNIWFTKSVDGGISFETPTVITTANSFAFPNIAAFGNNVYILFADAANYPMADYYLVSSPNKGDSFGEPLQVNDATCQTGIEFDGISSICVDDEGVLYLAWIDGRDLANNGDVYFAKSTDSGATISANVMVNDPGSSGITASQHKVAIAVYEDMVYISFSDRRLGEDFSDYRGYLSVSSNGGASFTSETLLGGNDFPCKFNDLTVSPTGKLFIGLCSSIDDFWNVYIQESSDGGTSFSEPLVINDNTTPTFDFSDLRIVTNDLGELFAFWKDNREGADDYNLYFARTDIGSEISSILAEYEISIYPNPASQSFSIKVSETNTDFELCITNLQGQVVYRELYTNSSQADLMLDIPAGIYFISVNMNNSVKSEKLIKI